MIRLITQPIIIWTWQQRKIYSSRNSSSLSLCRHLQLLTTPCSHSFLWLVWQNKFWTQTFDKSASNVSILRTLMFTQATLGTTTTLLAKRHTTPTTHSSRVLCPFLVLATYVAAHCLTPARRILDCPILSSDMSECFVVPIYIHTNHPCTCTG